MASLLTNMIRLILNFQNIDRPSPSIKGIICQCFHLIRVVISLPLSDHVLCQELWRIFNPAFLLNIMPWNGNNTSVNGGITS